MAFVLLKSCKVEGDLAQAILDMQQTFGDLAQSVLQNIASINNDLSGLDQGNILLSQETQQAPYPVGDFTQAAGLPQATGQLGDEQRLELVGIILINGVMYLAGIDDNISNFRKLYFALGADIGRFLSVINSAPTFAVVQTYLNVQPLPNTNAVWTTQAAQAHFGNPAIESVYTAGDGTSYCVIPQFLALNQSAQQAADQNNVSVDQITTQIFWFNQVTINSSTTNQLNKLGIAGDQLAATLANQRLIDLAPTDLTSAQGQFSSDTSQALSQIELLNNRWSQSTPASIEVYRKEILGSVQKANQDAFAIQNVVRLDPTLIADPQDIAVFLQKNSTADLEYLFSTRRTVTSINFKATGDQVMAAVSQAINIPAGSTTLSALSINNPAQSIDTEINQANQRLVQNTCALNQIKISPIPYQNLQIAYGCLQASITQQAPQITQAVPLTGFESYDSPASALFRQANISLSLGLDGLISDFENLAAKAVQPITEVCQALAAILAAASRAINQIFTAARAQINAWSQQIESFLSKNAALHGTAQLDGGILKCAFGYNISPTLPILNTIQQFLNNLQQAITNELAKLTQALYTFLNQLLCAPVNIANGFLGGIQNALPSFCQAYQVTLPQDLQQAMLNISNTFQFQGDIVEAYRRDLLNVSITMQGSPDRISQFKENLVCENKANADFFGAVGNVLGTGFSVAAPASGLPAIKALGA